MKKWLENDNYEPQCDCSDQVEKSIHEDGGSYDGASAPASSDQISASRAHLRVSLNHECGAIEIGHCRVAPH